ncbi:unnamed protein product [Prorocentrum cordatum]|uniref:Uncharacterized protein n=1 Tax=Prorocentrum cordatum TaxID=2364126 RepID=A0ABN9SYN0_9DINO|nr:unnamed protein product [Polarella glacialis]
MAYKSLKGISPAMQVKYWGEVIQKEQHEHMNHSLNTGPTQRRSDAPLGNPRDFYAGTWRALGQRYEQAAGAPSALVTMARSYTNQPAASQQPGQRPPTGLSAGSRPLTGASARSRASERSRAASVSSSQRRAMEEVFHNQQTLRLPPPSQGAGRQGP